MAGGGTNIALKIAVDTSDLSKVALGKAQLRDLETQIRSLTQTMNANKGGTEEQRVELEKLVGTAASAKAQVAQLTAAHREHTSAVGSNRAALMEAEHSARAFADGISAGIDPVRLLAMEGARLAQAFTELNGATQTAILRWAAILGPIVAVGGALAYVAGEALKAQHAIEQASNVTAFLGRQSENDLGVTAGRITELSKNFDMTTVDAAKLVEQFNRMPEATLSTRQRLEDMAVTLSKLTNEPVEDVGKKLTSGFGSVSAIESFLRENRMNTEETERSLEVAKKQNDVFAAQDVGLRALKERYKDATDQVADFAQKSSYSNELLLTQLGGDGDEAPDLVAHKPKIQAGEGPSDEEQRKADASRTSHFQQWNEDLQKQLINLGKFGKDALAPELAYWQDKQKLGNLGLEDEREVTSAIYRVRTEMAAQAASLSKKETTEEGKERKKAQEEQLRDLQQVTDQARIGTQARIDDAKKEVDYATQTWGQYSAQATAALRRVQEATKALSDQQDAMQREWVSAQGKLQQEGLQAQISGLDAEVATRQITANQKYQIERDLYARIWALQRQALQDEMANDKLTAAEKLKLYDQIVAGDQQQQVRIAAINKQQVQTEQQQNREIAQSLTSTLTGMLQHRQTFKQSVAQIGEQLLAKEVEQQLEALVGWIRTEVMKTAASETGAAATLTVKEGAAAAGKAVDATAGQTQVLGDAYKAAAGAYSAVASIPYVGPILAPIAAATAFTAVEAFNIFSAEGGAGSVPFDNAPFLLHKNEMVLPAHVADSVRAGMAGSNDNSRTFGDFNVVQNINHNQRAGQSSSASTAGLYRRNAQGLRVAVEKQMRR